MKKFAAVFTGTKTSPQAARWDALDEGTRNERIATGMKAWHDWAAKHADIILDQGGPLGKTKRATDGGIADTNNNMSGYCIVRADSHEAAARLFEAHPHFSIFPGDGVDIMEIMPIPTM